VLAQITVCGQVIVVRRCARHAFLQHIAFYVIIIVICFLVDLNVVQYVQLLIFQKQSIEFASIAPIFVYNAIISTNVNDAQSEFQSQVAVQILLTAYK